MAKYIKSHSNYVLRTKHQQTNDGTIFERDITTIGGRDQFARGQVPIYRSGNFVITTSNDNSVYKKVSETDWHRNEGGEIWTLDTLSHYQKDEKSSYDKKIVIKKDYFDLRDYAYYGSCSELMRVSIDDILKRYPGELYAPYETLYFFDNGDVQYTKEAADAEKEALGINYRERKLGVKGYFTSFENRKTRVVKDVCGNDAYLNSVSLIDPLTEAEEEQLRNGQPYVREFKYITDKYGNVKAVKSLALIDNPFFINMHSTYVPENGNPLKYFAEGGIDNYVAYIKDDALSDEWKIDKDHEYSITIENIEYDGLIDGYAYNIGAKGGNCDDVSQNICLPIIDVIITANKEKVEGCALECIDPGKYLGRIELCFRKNNYEFKTTPGLQRDANGNPMEVCCDGTLDYPGEGGENTALVDSTKESVCQYTLTVYMFMGNNNEVKYLVEDTDKKGEFLARNFQARIRSTTQVIDDYFNSLDLFERVLLNRNSDPIYTASFELISDDDYGMFTYTKQFTFPTTYGGYNLGSNTQNFANYLKNLSEIGEYYDTKFTDNLWRSMTHESIKNFDWTYTRHFTPGEEEPFVEGGTKIQKVIRLYGREFDEVKTYIDAIDDNNTVTYDNVNNLPDYFFTDKLSDYGWDVKLVHPLKLSEFVDGHDFIPIDINKLFLDKYDEDGKKITTAQAELMNYFYDSNDEKVRNKITIQRVFNQDFNTLKVKPYSCDNITYNCLDYFNTNRSKVINCNESVTLVASEQEKNDNCFLPSNVYCDETEYTSADVNSEFMKRFILNSPEIIKRKGTIDGIEMLLSLFGLRSKNSVYNNEKYFVTKKGSKGCGSSEGLSALLTKAEDCDPGGEPGTISVTTSSFEGKPVSYVDVNKSSVVDCEDSISLVAENSNCFTLTCEGERYYCSYKDYNLSDLYDYDIKEYTLFTTRQEDEWIPSKNMYKYDWINSTKLINYGKNGKYTSYQGLPVSYKEVEEGETKKRYLYPHFNTYQVYDGNPYYQMKGGWLAKYSMYGDETIPFMFDVKNNIVTKKPDGESRDLFTETVKNIKSVDTLQDLLTNPSLVDGNGDLCQVQDLSGRYAVIDGYVYPLETELTEEGGNGYPFFTAIIENNSLSVGNAFFTEYVVISNPYYPESKQKIDLTDDYNNNTEIKIYLIQDEDGKYNVDVYSKDVSISTFTVFENGHYMEGDNFTNYFMINNVNFYNELSVLGWQQLRDTDYEYFKMNTLIDYREGNNPHTGHMRYDNGYEYLTYFKKIFKYVDDNDLIDYRLYEESDMDYLSDLEDFGFKNLISEDDCDRNYDKFLRADNKCHYFGEIWAKVDADGNDVREGLPCVLKREPANSSMYEKIENELVPISKAYSLNNIYRNVEIDDSDGTIRVNNLRYGETYEKFGENGKYYKHAIDNERDQIVNTKRMEITFYIKAKDEYSPEWLEEVKYIDSVVLPYLTQMIPSTVIWSVKYVTRNANIKWDAVQNDCEVDHFEVNDESVMCNEMTNGKFTINLTANRSKDNG